MLQSWRFTTNASCGGHVHVDINDFDTAKLKQLVKLWMRYERVFAALVAPHRRESHYCRLTRETMGYRSRLPFAAVDRAHCGQCLIQTISAGSHRYHAMNLEAWWRHGTVEFRLHEGTIDSPRLMAWTEMLTALVELATCNVDVPAHSSTFASLMQDFSSHLKPASQALGLASAIKDISPKDARTVLVQSPELRHLKAGQLVDHFATKNVLGLYLDKPKLVTAMESYAYPARSTIDRYEPMARNVSAILGEDEAPQPAARRPAGWRTPVYDPGLIQPAQTISVTMPTNISIPGRYYVDMQSMQQVNPMPAPEPEDPPF